MQRFIRFCERTGYKLKFDFTGENIIITGGSIGLGFETANYFVSNGADIIICSRNINELEESAKKLSDRKINLSQSIKFLKIDVANTNEIDSLFEYSGTPDILVTCAGIYGPIGKLEDNSWDEWEYTVRVNLIGTVYCVRKVISIWKNAARSATTIQRSFSAF